MRPAPRGEPLDVRLGIAAAVAWAALACCVGRGVAVVTSVSGAAVALAVLGLVRGRSGRGGPLLRLAVLATLCVVAVLMPFGVRLALLRDAPLTALAERRSSVTLEVRTAGDPTPVAGAGVAGAPRVIVVANALRVVGATASTALGGRVAMLAPADGWAQLVPGQRLWVDGSLVPPARGSPDVLLVTHTPPRLVGRPPWWQRAGNAVRLALRRSASGLPDPVRGLLPGLVDGDTSGLDPVLQQHFRIAGLTHLLAVSGTNCTIVIGFVLMLLRRARARPWLCLLVGGLALSAFVVVARPTPSVLRAAFMAAVALLALGLGRRALVVPSLAMALLVLLLWNPWLATDAGFAMSVAATAALALLAPGWADALRRRHCPPVVAELLAVAAAANLVSAPIVAGFTGRVSLVAVPANVAAEPVVASATVLGFGAAVLAPVCLPVAGGLAWLAGWPCRWLVGVADLFGTVPGATIGWPSGVWGAVALTAVVCAIVWAARSPGSRRALAVVVAVLAVVQFPVRSVVLGWPPPGTLFVACDVGQGDGLVLPAGAGSAVVVDTGPSPVPIDRCLRDLGVSHIALLVLTHYHLDHVGGIDGALDGRSVAAVLTSPLLQPVTGVRLVAHALAPRHLVGVVPQPGQSWSVGPVELSLLGPAAAYHGTRSDPNNSSLVMMATVRGVRMLLGADAEIEAQQALLDAGVDLHADVLKVPHHGSAYSLPQFLAAVHARLGVVSVGLHNDYGLPAASLLRTLAALGMPVERTDRDGDVAITGLGGRLTAVRRGPAASATDGADAPSPEPRGSVADALSRPDARMGTCLQPGPSASANSASGSPRSRSGWCSYSVTRNCSSTAGCARSPPRRGQPSRQPWSPSSPVPRSRVRSCTSCSVRHCSATRGWC